MGGDFYNIRKIGKQQIRIFIADAIGHGIQASLITMVIQNEYSSIFDLNLSPGELLTKLSKKFASRVGDVSPFFSRLLLDLDLDKNRILFASSGNPACILTGGEKLESLQLVGPYAGILPEHNYAELSYDLPQDFRLILFTDGLPDRFLFSGDENEFFSIEDWIRNRTDEPLKNVCKKLSNLANSLPLPDFKKDDITLLGIERSNLESPRFFDL
ncbi:hypothetical protein A0128_06755 [Leptospira tipperaryensis]|uniref:PPM-type phosphatase domain-containing protein n=1 Tax=Leptospira tipperaryensis TaxID=2564040 RepID=A0A1D7UVK6_9LEPT|nr:PP2C family protein-serine/threonine phosphatase [Leptospira tipperaryensis]AOP33574.1 hypothetical protein A0128_06755 [Leptospira tipperaryensis]